MGKLDPLQFAYQAGECVEEDTALLSFLQGADQDHDSAAPTLGKWCADNFWELNASKIKELIIDFNTTGSIIQDENMEIVSSYKHSGTVFDNQRKVGCKCMNDC